MFLISEGRNIVLTNFVHDRTRSAFVHRAHNGEQKLLYSFDKIFSKVFCKTSLGCSTRGQPITSPSSSFGFGITWKCTWNTCWCAIFPLFCQNGKEKSDGRPSASQREVRDACLQDVVVNDTERFRDLLGEREDLGEMLIGHLVHPVAVIWVIRG